MGELKWVPAAKNFLLEKREEILNKEIRKYAGKGWRVTFRTSTTAQLAKDKKPACLPTLLLLSLGVIPGLLYMIALKGSDSLYLDVD